MWATEVSTRLQPASHSATIGNCTITGWISGLAPTNSLVRRAAAHGIRSQHNRPVEARDCAIIVIRVELGEVEIVQGDQIIGRKRTCGDTGGDRVRRTAQPAMNLGQVAMDQRHVIGSHAGKFRHIEGGRHILPPGRDDACEMATGGRRYGALRWGGDPIDGTSNFARGHPRFCVSLGLIEDRMPLLGVIVAPAMGETFAARQGAGLGAG